MSRVVGIACAALSVALLVYAVWVSVNGSRGMPSLLMALGLLLVAAITLRVGRTRRIQR